jgi:hypothetical protein
MKSFCKVCQVSVGGILITHAPYALRCYLERFALFRALLLELLQLLESRVQLPALRHLGNVHG